MNRRARLAEFAGRLVIDAGPEGIGPEELTKACVRHRLVKAGPHAFTTVRYAVLDARHGGELIIFDRTLRRYRRAIDAQDAANWRRLLADQRLREIRNLRRYARTEAERFAADGTHALAFEMLHEQLSRAERDLELAARLTFNGTAHS